MTTMASRSTLLVMACSSSPSRTAVSASATQPRGSALHSQASPPQTASPSRRCTSMARPANTVSSTGRGQTRTVARIWVLEDYDKEIWSLKYHVKIPRGTLCTIPNPEHLVLSHKGDVLVYNCREPCMLRCDNTGKLLEEFQCHSWSMSLTGHCLKENLAKHDFFLRRGRAWDEQQFFKGSKV